MSTVKKFAADPESPRRGGAPE